VFAVRGRPAAALVAGDALPRVKAPTLLIVGERDPKVLVPVGEHGGPA
jgi:hypothetical protein